MLSLYVTSTIAFEATYINVNNAIEVEKDNTCDVSDDNNKSTGFKYKYTACRKFNMNAEAQSYQVSTYVF